MREISLLQEHLREDVAAFIYDRLRRRPMVLPVVVEVSAPTLHQVVPVAGQALGAGSKTGWVRGLPATRKSSRDASFATQSARGGGERAVGACFV